MKTILVFLTILLQAIFLPILPQNVSIKEDESLAILEKFRKILSVDREYKVTGQMALYTPDQKPQVKKYTVYAQNDKTLLIFTQPERDRGKIILLIKDQLWQYFPKIQKTLVINASMNLSGGLNLSDILSSTLFQWYGFTRCDFSSEGNLYILTFQALTRNSPYGTVKYYFSDGKIEYFEAYARSGILLKKVVFVKYDKDEQGQIFPSQLKIINALAENDYTLIQMSSYQAMKIPAYYFNPSALDKVSE
ncbi:MAG: outer membrane lipoprotein-sorting protein [Spirochaetia bacterium]|nr:outer membrane lipoprotein-sorting protein [Spirochaetia bacterium]